MHPMLQFLPTVIVVFKTTPCPEKKRPNVFFCNIIYKTLAILVKFAGFKNKFAAKLCSCFPPHLNNDSTLPYET